MRKIVTLLPAAALGLFACGTDPGEAASEGQPADVDAQVQAITLRDGTPWSPDRQAREAVIDIVHASPNAPAVDIYANDNLTVPGLGYRTATGNVALPSGHYDVKIRAAGADPKSNPVFETALDLKRGEKLLLIAEGRLNDTGATAFTVAAYPYGRRGEHAARVRLIHASPSAPAVDITDHHHIVLRDTAYGDASHFFPFFFGVRKGTDLGIRATGGATDLADVTLPALPTGAVVSAIAFGEINPIIADDRFFAVSAVEESSGKLLDLPVTISSKADARLYVFHASPDTPAVDVAVHAGPVLVSALSYQNASAELAVPGGVYPIEVRPAGTDVVALAANFKLLPGLDWTVFARGLLGDKTLALSAIAQGAPAPASGDVTLRVVHASPDAPAVDIASNGTVVVSNLSFTQGSAYLSVPAKDLVGALTVRAAGSKTDLFSIPISSATASAIEGATLSAFATGTLGNAAEPFTAVAVVESPAKAPLTSLPLTTNKL